MLLKRNSWSQLAGVGNRVRRIDAACGGAYTSVTMAFPPRSNLHPLLQTLYYMFRPIEFVNAWHHKYGDCFVVKTAIFGDEVIICDPEDIRRIFTSDPNAVHAGEANVFLRHLVGNQSVLLLDGAPHLEQRRLLLPPFHGERMKVYAATMAEITQKSIATWPEGRSFSLHPYMQQLTLDIILRTVFGVSEGARLDALRKTLTRILNRFSGVFAPLGMIPALQRDLGPLTPWAAFLRDITYADGLIYQEIADRKHLRDTHDDRQGSDILSMLLDAKHEDGSALSDKELRDELMTLLAAGHETTAVGLCWAFAQVLSHPAVKQRLTDELQEVTKGGDVTPEHLSKLTYLDATLKEVLRLKPVVPAVGRILKQPMRVHDYDLPVGTLVVPSIYLTQRRPSVYPDPEAFRPERFLDKKTDPYTWFPFGGGVRRCIGMAFALYEMKVVMATVLSRTSLTLAQKRPLRTYLRVITLAPEGGTRVVARRVG